MVKRDLEELEIIKARAIAWQKRGLVCQNPEVSHAKKR